MNINIKPTEKERHILYRLLAVVLLIALSFVFIIFNMYIIKEWNAPNWIAILTGCLFWFFGIPIWKHYS